MAETVYRDDALWVVNKPHGVDSQKLYQTLRKDLPELSLPHRLDQPASGLLLMVVDPSHNRAIAEGFRSHHIQRRYVAVLMSPVSKGTVWTWPVDGKRALTRVEDVRSANGMSAAHLSLETGRTHQIRKHCAQAGAPIAGDRRYGDDAGRSWPRLCLHAEHLELDHPGTGERLALTAAIPADMRTLWVLAGGN